MFWISDDSSLGIFDSSNVCFSDITVISVVKGSR